MFNLAVIFCIGYKVVAWVINSSMSDRNGGKKARLSESTCVTSDVSSSSNSLGIMCTLEKLNLPRKIDPVCSTEVSKKGFGLTSERDPRLGVNHSDSSNISEAVPILAHFLLATNLTFFCNICSGLSTGYTNLAHCAVKV